MIVGFHNQSRVVKRRMMAIGNAKRKTHYKDACCELLNTTGKVIGIAKGSIDVIKECSGYDLDVVAMSYK